MKEDGEGMLALFTTIEEGTGRRRSSRWRQFTQILLSMKRMSALMFHGL
jgi:hypothetical protein